ncbi:MAG: hypothetical protein JEZ06_14050 [Anaerolineaceae bacterium]|nr:hypothetical protein [Anaerolineaceae bacterium]
MEVTQEKKHQIMIKGNIDPGWSEWLADFKVKSSTNEEGETISLFSGKIEDQSALRGILNKLWDLNIEIISFQQLENEDSNGSFEIKEGNNSNETNNRRLS